MLDLAKLDLDEIATALEDQTAFDHSWMIDPATGQIHLWTSDTGIDGQNPIELDEVDLLPIDPVPSWVWYHDMVDFAESITDATAGRRLARALEGKGAFRRFKNELYEEYAELVSAWQSFREIRARRRAVEWLLEEGLLEQQTVDDYVAGHPDPQLP